MPLPLRRKEAPVRVISVNVGGPQQIEIGGRTVRTSIFKSPVRGRIKLFETNLAGDQQSDLSVHGGPDKAVYLYPSEHYRYWKEQLPEIEMPWGMFGENLTTAGLDERTVHVGDVFRFGSAVLRVTQPRMPCYKLGIRFGRKDIMRRFSDSGRSGFYLSVVREGVIGAGDPIELVSVPAERVSIAGMLRY